MYNDKVNEARRNASTVFIYDEYDYGSCTEDEAGVFGAPNWVWVPPEDWTFKMRLLRQWQRIKRVFGA